MNVFHELMMKFQNKKIIITGGNGFIGSNLAKRLADFQCETHITIRESSNFWRFENFNKLIEVHTVNLQSYREVKKLFKLIKPDYVFNLAEPSPTKLEEVENYLNRSNLATKMVTNLMEVSHERDVKKIVHACGSSIYGIENSTPYTESEEPKPDSKRGMIKLIERNICKYYARKYQVPVVLGRIFRAYGPWDSDKKLIIKTLDAISKNKHISLVNPKIKRDYIYIDDVLDSLLMMCITKLNPGTEINAGSGNQYSAQTIVALLCELYNQNSCISTDENYPLSPMDKKHWVANIQKAKSIINWEPRICLKEGLNKVVDWYKSQYTRIEHRSSHDIKN